MQRFSVHRRLQRDQRPSTCVVCLLSSLLVGVRAKITYIKVVRDKTGCHRFACNVNWAWFLLWAGSAALHFYSNPPKTIPCVIWLRNLPNAEKDQVGGTDVRKPGPFSVFFYSGTPGYNQLYISTAGVGWVQQRGHQRAPSSGLVRNQNGLGLVITAASSHRQKQLRQKLRQSVIKIKAQCFYIWHLGKMSSYKLRY